MPTEVVETFTRSDGRILRVVNGLRQKVLDAPRASVQPKSAWTAADFRVASEKKLRELRRLTDDYCRHGGRLEGATMLEVGCGAGLDTLLMATHPVRAVVGIDAVGPGPASNADGLKDRLMHEVFATLGEREVITTLLRTGRVRFAQGDARQLPFPDSSFDLLWSRAAMEHIVPPVPALREMARVVRPGGLLYHSIDLFYWLRGCHKRGLVDLPWAHARLAPAEYHEFVAQTEGTDKAVERSRHLMTLNQFTARRWRQTIEAGPFEILEWQEDSSPLAETLLAEHPEVPETLLSGLSVGDLTCRSVKVWMRNTGQRSAWKQ